MCVCVCVCKLFLKSLWQRIETQSFAYKLSRAVLARRGNWAVTSAMWKHVDFRDDLTVRSLFSPPSPSPFLPTHARTSVSGDEPALTLLC